MEELYGTQYQSGSFSLINVGSGFQCLHSFFFSFSNPLPKRSTSHHRPFISKVKSHAGIIGNKYADAHSRKSSATYSDVADASIKTAGPDGNPFYNICWLAKDMKNTESYKITQKQPSHLPQGFGTYFLITTTPCKHTCTPSTN